MKLLLILRYSMSITAKHPKDHLERYDLTNYNVSYIISD